MNALELQHAGVALGGRTVWHDANIAIPTGAIVAILGPNGAGKSTLLNVVMGLTPSTGHVRILGHEPTRGARDVGYMPQSRPSEARSSLRVRDYVGLAVDGHRFGWRRDGHKHDTIDEALRVTGAIGFANRPLRELSGGQRQRVALAQALVGRPGLLLLDEPLAALDLAAQAEIVDLIHHVRNDTGATIAVVAHDLNPLAAIVDYVVWIARGRVRCGTPDEVVNAEVLSDLYEHDVEIIVTPRGRRVIVGLEEEFAHPHPHGHDHSHEGPHEHGAAHVHGDVS
jgi:zinc/manganese transport system ATP-binding protein